MAVSLVGTPTAPVEASGSNTGTVTGTWSGTQPRTTGHLLIAMVTAYGTTTAGAISNTGATWTQITSITASSVAESSMWQRTATGADAAPTFTATMTGTAASARMVCELVEITGQDPTTPVVLSDTGTGTTALSVTNAAGAIPNDACLALLASNVVSASGALTWTPANWWVNVGNTGATTAVDHASLDWLGVTTGTGHGGVRNGVSLTVAPTYSLTSTFTAGVLAIIQPPVTGTQITATQGAAGFNGGMLMRVLVLDGAAKAQAQTGASGVASPAMQASVTTTTAGSLVVGGAAGFPNATYTQTAATTEIDNLADVDNSDQYCTGQAAALTITPGAVTMGWTPAATAGVSAFYEVLPAGTITTDASSPSVVWNTSANNLITEPVNYPAGVLLVAIVLGAGSGSVTKTNVTAAGMSWRQVAVEQPAGQGHASVWVATPGYGVGSVGAPVNTHSATGSVTGTWSTRQTRTAGNVLVAAVSCAASTSVTATATASGWSQAAGAGIEEPNSGTAHARTAIWSKVATGADAAPTFTSTEAGTAGGMDCVLFELTGANAATLILTSGVYASGASSGTVTGTATTGTVTVAGAYAIAIFAQNAAAAILTWADSGTGGFTDLLNGNGVSSVLQTYAGVMSWPVTPATLNDAGVFSVNTTAYGAGIVAVFYPPQFMRPSIVMISQ